ncbi:MAG: EF-P lysine aminoacylase GenX [Magnetococcales bacterium]|nr:EF-P lysine aminoacylase GenX [Magnetococcales bacterium]
MSCPSGHGQDWRPSASLKALQTRANTLATLRAFFQERGVMEVETPALASTAAAESHLEPISCPMGYLQTSPESAMKRLLAAGSGPIYQISHAFRSDEQGPSHNPEFTMLEWYRPGWSYHQLRQEVLDLVQRCMDCGPAETITYRAAFQRYAGVDPFSVTEEQLEAEARQLGLTMESSMDRDSWLDLLMVERVEPGLAELARAVFIVDFPTSRAAMAQIRPDHPPVAERFELYLDGLELANGYQELIDPKEQRHRLMEENRQRHLRGANPLPLDERFLAALDHGLPACAGVALGVDRLLMAEIETKEIAQVMAFPKERA